MKNIRTPTVVGLIKAEIEANKELPAISSADAGKLATVDSNGKWAAANLTVGQGEVAVDSTLLVSGAAADAKVTGNKIGELKSAIDDVTVPNYQAETVDVSALGTPMQNISGFAQSATRAAYSANNGTDCILYEITEPTTFYFGTTNANYLACVVLENPVGEWKTSGSNTYRDGKSAVRYRNTDNNLPSQLNPYTTSNADLLIIITSGKTANITLITQSGVVLDLAQTTGSNDKKAMSQKAVTDAITQNLTKKPCLQYVPVDTSALPNSYYKQELDIYIPTTVGFIKYLFVRNELDSSNANNWRLDKAFAYSDNKEQRFLVVNGGEYEMALQIDGRSDFIGGIAHGDEVINDITFLVNGNEISDITSLTNITEFDELKIVETTKLYDPADGATLSTVGQFTPCATHGKEYTFTKDGIRLRQFVKWLKAETLTASYMTMFPIVRGNDSVSELQITDTFYADDDYLNYDVSTIVGASGNAWAWRKNIEHAVIWSDESGVSAEVIMLKQPMIENNGARQFKVQDSSAYNKLYWSVCGVGNALYNATINERFVTESLYKVDICK